MPASPCSQLTVRLRSQLMQPGEHDQNTALLENVVSGPWGDLSAESVSHAD